MLVKFRSYDTYIPESSTRLAELITGIDIFFSDIFSMSATVLRIADGSVALDAIDPLISAKVCNSQTLMKIKKIKSLRIIVREFYFHERLMSGTKVGRKNTYLCCMKNCDKFLFRLWYWLSCYGRG